LELHCVDERVDGGVCVTKPEDEDNPTFREVHLGNIGEHIGEEEGEPADEEDDQDDHQGLCSVDIIPQGFIPVQCRRNGVIPADPDGA